MDRRSDGNSNQPPKGHHFPMRILLLLLLSIPLLRQVNTKPEFSCTYTGIQGTFILGTCRSSSLVAYEYEFALSMCLSTDKTTCDGPTKDLIPQVVPYK